jgi:hypothetical protein
MESFAWAELAKAVRNRQTVRVRDRALPVAGLAEEGPAHIGFEGQQPVLEWLLAGRTTGTDVVLSADRFYPSVAWFAWLDAHGWGYRRRLTGHVLVDPGEGQETTTGALA